MVEKQKYWFRPKRFGYGVYPISVEGWGMTLLFAGIIVGVGYGFGMFSSNVSEKNVLIFVLNVFVLCLIFIRLVQQKTDGKIQWNWGRKRDKK